MGFGSDLREIVFTVNCEGGRREGGREREEGRGGMERGGEQLSGRDTTYYEAEQDLTNTTCMHYHVAS